MNNLTDQELGNQLAQTVHFKRICRHFWFSQWFKTSLLLFNIAALVLTITGFITKFDGNFQVSNKQACLIFGIVFLVLLIIGISCYLTIKKMYKRWVIRSENNLLNHSESLIPIYQAAINDSELIIKRIDRDFEQLPQVILPPTYYEIDQVISGTYRTIPFQVGSVSIRSRLDLHHNSASIRTVKDQQDNCYRMIILAIQKKTPFNDDEHIVIWKKDSPIKYMVEFNNIYNYDSKNAWINQLYFQKEIINAIGETHFVPNIEITNNFYFLSLNIFAISDLSDTTYQFFNVCNVFDQKKPVQALLQIIKQDCIELNLIKKWIQTYFIN